LISHPLLKALQSKGANNSGVQYFDYENERWYGAYSGVEFGNLYLITQASHQEVKRAQAVLLKRSVIFGLIVINVTFLAGILFSRRLTKNLSLLTDGAIKIGRGELDTKISLRTGDEVEELANSFNKMIIDLKASREAIESYNRELEKKVAERTQELHEKNVAIKDAQEKLIRTTQLAAVGEIAGRTAHEVLNPLTAILSRVETERPVADLSLPTSPLSQIDEILLAWEKDFKEGGVPKLANSLKQPSQIQEGQTLLEEDLSNLRTLVQNFRKISHSLTSSFDFIGEQASRIHRIVNGMRELTRSSSFKEDTHCHQAIKDASSTMSDFLSKHQITLTMDLTAKEDLASLNRDEFVQILTNLIRNAFQATLSAENTSNPTRTVHIMTTNEGDLLLVDVIDHGVGVHSDRADVIFDYGFTTKPPGEGTGIGLSVCRRYARAFGGDVNLAYSDPLQGTCFRIQIPLKQEEKWKLAV